MIGPSPTFTPNSPRLTNAVEQATVAITSSDLSVALRVKALSNLQSGNFVTNTPGSGGLKNSVQVRYCLGKVCGK